MEVRGIIKAIMPARSGVTKAGKEWRSQEFVVEDTTGRYPVSYVLSVFNREIGADEGDEVEVRFDGNAHEWNGRWFNDLRAYEVKVVYADEPKEKPKPKNGTIPVKQTNDELPF